MRTPWAWSCGTNCRCNFVRILPEVSNSQVSCAVFSQHRWLWLIYRVCRWSASLTDNFIKIVWSVELSLFWSVHLTNFFVWFFEISFFWLQEDSRSPKKGVGKEESGAEKWRVALWWRQTCELHTIMQKLCKSHIPYGIMCNLYSGTKWRILSIYRNV